MSRITEARRQARIARIGIGIAAATALAAFAAAARVSHPATHTGRSTAVNSSEDDSFSQSWNGFFGSDDDSSGIAPAQGSPQVESGAS